MAGAATRFGGAALPGAAGGGGRPLSVGLLWHSARSGNLGVGALTLANMAIARSVATDMGLEPRFTVLGMRDGDAPRLVGEDVSVETIDTRAMIPPGGYWRALGGLDCVLDIGAGDSFADIYGPKRFGFLWLTKLYALARRVPLLLSPQTIGPFTRSPYRQLAAAVMNRARAVVARDAPSLAVLRGMAPRAHALLATDVAFVLPYVDRSAERGGGTGGRLRVGINASGLLFHQAETGRNRFGLSIDYARFTRALIAALLARGDVTVELIAHATSAQDAGDDDRRLADALAAEFPGTVRVADFPGPSEAKSHLSGLDFLVAGRMHACIGAFSAGTPVVPVAYSRKFAGLFGSLGYDWMVPVTGRDDAGALAYVLDALDRRAVLAADAAAGMARVNALLDVYRGALAGLFADVTGAAGAAGGRA